MTPNSRFLCFLFSLLYSLPRRAVVSSWLSLLLLATATALPAATTTTKPKPASTITISRTKLRFDEVESSLTDLLAIGQSDNARVVALKISYRMLIHRLYEAAAQSKNEDFRAQLALKADKLADQAPAFDALAAKFAGWQNSLARAGNSPEEAKIKARLLAAAKAGPAFEKATEKANQDLNDATALRKFLADMLPPLEPAVLLDNNDQPLPTAWPESGSPETAPVLPSLEATLSRVQQANIMPELRTELLAVLPKIKDAQSAPDTTTAADPYQVLLDVLTLAEQLSASSALSLDARTDLNQQLRKSLILFKDPRTRESALRRLAGVGDIAAILTRLEQSSLDTTQKQVVGAAMHQAILKLSVPATAPAARTMLNSLDRLIIVQADLAHSLDQAPIATAREEWKKLRTTGDTLLAALLERLQTDAGADVAKVDDTVKRLEQLLRNSDALAVMPTLLKRSEAFKPNPRPALERKMTLWARTIADAPDTSTAAADEIRLLGKALSTLEFARAGIPPADADPQSLTQIAGDRYKTFLAKFNDSESKLILGLSLPAAQLTPLLASAENDSRLLKATQALLTLQSGPLDRLNLWGGWQLDPAARALLLAETTHTITNAYLTQTGSLPTTDALVTPRIAEDALDHLVTMARRLKDKLPAPAAAGKPANWALTYTATSRGPTPHALLAPQSDKLALICYLLNEAACNNDNAGSDIATNTALKKALETLAAIPIEP